MRVPHDGVGAPDTGNEVAILFAQARGRAVRAVDVEPEAVLRTEVRDFFQGVVGPCGRAAGVGDHSDNAPALFFRKAQRVLERVGSEPELIVVRHG